jgi:hypothetical protein
MESRPGVYKSQPRMRPLLRGDVRSFSEKGIMYEASPLTASFLGYMQEPYTKRLQERAQWVIARFGDYSDAQLVDFFKANLDRWGGEFIREELLEDEVG